MGIYSFFFIPKRIKNKKQIYKENRKYNKKKIIVEFCIYANGKIFTKKRQK